NEALDRSALHRQEVATNLSAFLSELRATLPDVDLSTNTSLEAIQAYFDGLANPLTDDPFLRIWQHNVTTAVPALDGIAADTAQQVLAQLDAATPVPATGSAFTAIEQVIAFLEGDTGENASPRIAGPLTAGANEDSGVAVLNLLTGAS